jgi:hypothetical protein
LNNNNWYANILKTSAYSKISPENIDIIKKIIIPKLKLLFNFLQKNKIRYNEMFKLNNNDISLEKETGSKEEFIKDILFINKYNELAAAICNDEEKKITLYNNVFVDENLTILDNFPINIIYNTVVHEFTHMIDPYIKNPNFSEYNKKIEIKNNEEEELIRYFNATHEMNADLSSLIEEMKSTIEEGNIPKEYVINMLKNKEIFAKEFILVRALQKYLTPKNYNKFINIIYREIVKFYEERGQ